MHTQYLAKPKSKIAHIAHPNPLKVKVIGGHRIATLHAMCPAFFEGSDKTGFWVYLEDRKVCRHCRSLALMAAEDLEAMANGDTPQAR